MAMLPFAVMALSSLISYQRAKAESLGLDAKGGLMERAERIVLLCIGLLFEPLLVPVLWVMLALTAITAVQRFVKVWRQAAGRPGHGGAHRAAPLAGARAVGSPAPSAGARGCRGAAPDGRSTRRGGRSPCAAADRRALTVGGYRTGAARWPGCMPGVVADGLAPPIGFGASFANAERRAIDRAAPAAGQPDAGRTSALAPAVQERVRLATPATTIESFRLPSLSARTVDRRHPTSTGFSPRHRRARRRATG